MDDQLVTIRIFNNSMEANIAKGKLETEGIYAFIANESLMSSPILQTTVGQVELQVKKKEVEKAQKILDGSK